MISQILCALIVIARFAMPQPGRMDLTYAATLAIVSWMPVVSAHSAFWTPAMYGFNVTDKSFPYDNRPVTPLQDYTFEQWWFHGHLDHPPNPGDVFDLPAGGTAKGEIACNKGATSHFATSEGGDIRDKNNPNNPCPGSDMAVYHTTGINDLFGCALAIAYKSDARAVQPEDFTVFSVNHRCVWDRFTDFQVPERMPPCPEGGCTCAWFWIHSPDAGSEQNYMNGFKCNVTGSSSTVSLAKPQVPRRCGADPPNGKLQATPGNCTYGAKQPFYWFQKERNNMFEGAFSPPRYLDMYNFLDGAQNDIFQDSYPNGLPTPGPNNTIIPTPYLGGPTPAATAITTPPQSPAPTSSASVAISSSSSLSSSIAPPSSSSAVSTGKPSASVSTATVVSTSVVSVTVTPTPVPSTVVNTVVVTVTASPSTSSQPTPSTVFNTVVVTLTDTNTRSSAASASPTSSSSGSPPIAPLISIAASNNATPTDAVRVAQLERVLEASGALSDLPTSTTLSIKMCGKQQPILQKRESTWLSIPASARRHRKLKSRASLWKFW